MGEIHELLNEVLKGLEGRLTTAITKALDTVTTDQNKRLQALEEDMAHITRHLGLDKRKED